MPELIPTGYTKISGDLNTRELQQAQFDDIQVVGTQGAPGSYLIGKPKGATGLTPVTGDLFNTRELQDLGFSGIQQFGKTGEAGSYLAGKLRGETVSLPDGRTFRVDPLSGKASLVTDKPTAGSATGAEVTSDEIIEQAGSTNTPESIASLIGSFERSNKEAQAEILKSFKPSERETSLQKQIDDILSSTQKGIFNVEGRPIPMEDIAGEQERLLRNSNILLMPLQQEMTRLAGGREAQGKAATAALGFQAQNQELQLKMLDEIQKPMRAAAEATQKFVLDLALKYPDSGITIEDSAASASTKAANSASFKASVTQDTKTQVVDTPQGTLLIDSATGAIIRNYGPGGAELAKKDQRANQLADQFVGQEVVKNFNLISGAVATVNALPSDTATAADDQALLYAFAKAMDPNSVVREGEYATIQKYSQSWLQQFGVDVQRVFENKPLFPDTTDGRAARQNLKTTIGTKYQASKLQYESVRDAYAGQINHATGGTDGADYLIDFSKFNATGTGQVLSERKIKDQNDTFNGIYGNEPASGGSGATIHGVDPVANRKLAEAIAEVETPPSAFKTAASRYNAKGTVVTMGMYKGDRAYGKYQIMGKNIPSWTKQALGRSLSVAEFLADPGAQDATAMFHVARHYKKYGNPDDVASMWFTGRPAAKGANFRDDNNTSGSRYIALVRSSLKRMTT